MTQDADLDRIVRQRIRSLRTAHSWTLDELAARAYLSPSTLSRIETGGRRIALDQLAPIARALGVTIDELVDTATDEDVVIRPRRDTAHGATIWPLTRQHGPGAVSVVKMRITRSTKPELRVHPGRDWFFVLSGTARLWLAERQILVPAGQAAEFSTMTPHAVSAHNGPVETLNIFDSDGRRAHLHRRS